MLLTSLLSSLLLASNNGIHPNAQWISVTPKEEAKIKESFKNDPEMLDDSMTFQRYETPAEVKKREAKK